MPLSTDMLSLPTQPLIAVASPDPAARRMLTLVLTARGHGVRELPADGGLDHGWETISEAAALCLDLSPPEAQPLQLVRRLRHEHPHLCILVLGSGRDSALAAEAMREGAYDHLVKPLEPDRVVQAVDRAIERHALDARLRSLEALIGGGAANDGERARPEGIVPLPELERREIRRALQATGGSVGKAAKLLGLSRATLYRRLAEAP